MAGVAQWLERPLDGEMRVRIRSLARYNTLVGAPIHEMPNAWCTHHKRKGSTVENTLLVLPETAQWRKSTRSGAYGDNCVEVAVTADVIGVRDSKDTAGPVLLFTRGEWDAFVGGAKDGEFDL